MDLMQPFENVNLFIDTSPVQEFKAADTSKVDMKI